MRPHKIFIRIGTGLVVLFFALSVISFWAAPVLWSRTIVVSTSHDISDHCIRQAVSQLPGMAIYDSGFKDSDPILVHTALERYRIATMVKHPAARTVTIFAYGPGILNLEPWRTYGRLFPV